MDSQRKYTTYQCARTEGSIVCSKGIHEKQIRLSHTCQGRQYNNNSLHQQDGGHKVTKPDISNERSLGLLHIENDHDYCGARPRQFEPDSRSPEQTLQEQQQLEATDPDFKQIEECRGPVEIDLFADRIDTQKTKFMSWKPDPEAQGEDAFSVKWTSMKAYAFSPFCLIGRVLAKIGQDQATMIIVTPTWRTAGRQQTNPGIMENFGQNNPSRGMSEATKQLLDQTRRPGSKRTYATPLRKNG